MLRRSLCQLESLWSVRRVFTFAGGGEVKELAEKAPRPFDVDEVVKDVREAEGIKIYRKGHITTSVLKSDLQPMKSRRRRRREETTQKEKYMLKKMSRFNQTGESETEVNPLYEMTRPWLGFSPVKDRKEKRELLSQEQTSSQTEDVVLHVDKTTESAKPFIQRRKIVKKRGSVSPNYFKTIDNCEKQWDEKSEERMEARREVIAERIATRLHQTELQSRHAFLKEPAESESQPEDNAELEAALLEDPTFQRDTLKFEAESKDMKDLDEWLSNLQTFTSKHERVLVAMDKPKEKREIDTLEDPLSSHTLTLEMEANGIDVKALEHQAQQEIETDLQRTN